MRLVNDVEAMINILGKETGNFIITNDGDATPKNRYNHFLILHSFAPDEWEEKMNAVNGFDCIKKKTKSKREEKTLDEELKELSEDLAEREIEEEEAAATGEVIYNTNEASKARVVARRRKITVYSEVQLNDNGWFLCPVYEGMDGLYPMMFRLLPKNKGYQMFMAKVPLVKFPEDMFTEENKADWNNNAMFMVDKFLQKTKVYNIRTYSVYVHRKDSDLTSMIRKLISQFDTCQKSRIKQGNILVDEVLTTVGQNAYISNKENLSKKKKGSDEEVNDYDIKEIKIIDEVMKAYKKITDKANEKGLKFPVTEPSFNNIRKAIIVEEKKEEEAMVNQYIKDHADEFESPLTEEDKEDIRIKLHTLNSSEYISTYVIYMSCAIYDTYIKNESMAERALGKVVKSHPLWTKVMADEKGLGTIIAARLIANIDIEGTNHPSSIIKYVGLDQVIVRPDHSDGVAMSEKELHDIICVLYKDWQIINYNTTLEDMPELTKDTYDVKFKSDCLPTYDAYVVATKAFKDMEANKIANIADILIIHPLMKDIVKYVWNNMIVMERMTADGPDYVIQKRARNKSDKAITTYLNKNGQIELKGGLGYNAQMKSNVLQIIVNSFLKTKNETYVKIYEDAKNKQRQQCIARGVDPEAPGIKIHIHKRAVRITGQRFLENYWIASRMALNLPLNGGTYYEGKIQGRHLHGINPAIFKD